MKTQVEPYRCTENTWCGEVKKTAKPFSKLSSEKNNRKQAQTEMQEIPLKHKKKVLTVRVVKHWMVAQRDWGVSILGAIQNLTGHNAGQHALGDAALNRRIRVDNLH